MSGASRRSPTSGSRARDRYATCPKSRYSYGLRLMRTLTAPTAYWATRCLAAWLGVAAVALAAAQTPSPDTGRAVLIGRVLDAGTDAPVAGAVVSLSPYTPVPARTLSGGAQPRHVMTTADGDFLVRDLEPGRYAITALAFGYEDATFPPNVVEVTITDRPVRVSVHLWKRAAISGRVVDDIGEPIGGVPVTALARVALGGALVLRQTFVQALTDDRGIYRLSNLAPGRYVVGVLSSATTLPASVVRDVDAASTDRAAAAALRRSLQPSGARIETGDGLRSGDAVLQLAGPMAPPAPDGRLQVYPTVFFPGASSIGDASLVSVGSGDERDGVDLTLSATPALRVSGIVSGPDGPMTKVAIRLLPPSAVDMTDYNPAGAATAITDANGAFTFLGVAPGQYTLKAAFVPGGTPTPDPATALWAVQPVAIGERDVDDLVVTMRPGARVSGRVEFTGAAGSTAPDPGRVRVHLRPIGAQTWRPSQGPAAADWTFRTGGEPPGRYVANISAPADWTLQSVTVRGQSNADAVIELGTEDLSGLVYTFSDRPSQVTGAVVDANPETSFVDVIVFPADTSFWREGIFQSLRVARVRASSSGAFTFPSLMLGDYYAAAVSVRLAGAEALASWPAFLERLIAGATRFTLRADQDTTLELKTFSPRER
jgi:hypothetical protein